MNARILDGRVMAEELLALQCARCASITQRGVTPGLAVVIVGENPASQKYVASKERACLNIGIRSFTHRLPEDCGQAAIERVIDEMNADERIHGILVQLPLPKGVDENAVLNRIAARKDVDGFHPINMGKLLQGQPGVLPCTPRGVMRMLKEAGTPLEGAHAVVVGRSNIVGKPMAALLLRENATVTLCHSRTKDLKSFTRTADVLVAAVGASRFITADMVKPGATVIDVGINRVDGKIVGDVDFDVVSQVAGAISPVPGGVGKLTVAMLMENTLDAAEACLNANA